MIAIDDSHSATTDEDCTHGGQPVERVIIHRGVKEYQRHGSETDDTADHATQDRAEAGGVSILRGEQEVAGLDTFRRHARRVGCGPADARPSVGLACAVRADPIAHG